MDVPSQLTAQDFLRIADDPDEQAAAAALKSEEFVELVKCISDDIRAQVNYERHVYEVPRGRRRRRKQGASRIVDMNPRIELATCTFLALLTQTMGKPLPPAAITCNSAGGIILSWHDPAPLIEREPWQKPPFIEPLLIFMITPFHAEPGAPLRICIMNRNTLQSAERRGATLFPDEGLFSECVPALCTALNILLRPV